MRNEEPHLYFGKWPSSWADFNVDLGQLAEQWATRRLGLDDDCMADVDEYDTADIDSTLAHLQRPQDIGEKHRRGRTSVCIGVAGQHVEC